MWFPNTYHKNENDKVNILNVKKHFKKSPVVKARTSKKHALKIAICYKKFKKINRQIAQTSLFQMRYDSQLNPKKWPSDRPKGSATLVSCQLSV